MADKEIIFGTPIDLGITANKIQIRRINLKTDDSGEWQIGVDYDISSPARGESNGVSLIERYMVNAQIKVLRSEIANHLNIDENDVRTTLTLAQTETAVTEIALSKLAVLGLAN